MMPMDDQVSPASLAPDPQQAPEAAAPETPETPETPKTPKTPPPPKPESYVEAETWALEKCSTAKFASPEEARVLYAEAADLFEQALKLPGDDYDVRRVSAAASPVGGAPVLRDLTRVTFASTLQKQTAHFNIACCRAKTGEVVESLDALEMAFTLGFDDFGLVDKERDFDDMRADVDRLVKEFKPKGGLDLKGPLSGLMGLVDGAKKQMGSFIEFK